MESIMAIGKTKTVKFNSDGVKNLPNDKLVIYKILTGNENNNYAGIAKKGRVQNRIKEHFLFLSNF